MRSYNYNDLKPCTFPVCFFLEEVVALLTSVLQNQPDLLNWICSLTRQCYCLLYLLHPCCSFPCYLERAFALLAFKRDAFWQPQICNTVFHSGLPQLQQVYSLDTVSLHLVSYFFLCGASAILFCRTWFAFIMYYGGYNFVLYLVFNHGQLLVLVEGMPALV